jgi:hypothetical protein
MSSAMSNQQSDEYIAYRILDSLTNSSVALDFKLYSKVIKEDLGLSSEVMDRVYNWENIVGLLKPKERVLMYKGKPLSQRNEEVDFFNNLQANHFTIPTVQLSNSSAYGTGVCSAGVCSAGVCNPFLDSLIRTESATTIMRDTKVDNVVEENTQPDSELTQPDSQPEPATLPESQQLSFDGPDYEFVPEKQPEPVKAPSPVPAKVSPPVKAQSPTTEKSSTLKKKARLDKPVVNQLPVVIETSQETSQVSQGNQPTQPTQETQESQPSQESQETVETKEPLDEVMRNATKVIKKLCHAKAIPSDDFEFEYDDSKPTVLCIKHENFTRFIPKSFAELGGRWNQLEKSWTFSTNLLLSSEKNAKALKKLNKLNGPVNGPTGNKKPYKKTK